MKNKNHVVALAIALANCGETRRNAAAVVDARDWLARGDADPTGREWMVGWFPTPEDIARRRSKLLASLEHLSGPMARKAARARCLRKQKKYLSALNRHNSALAQASAEFDPLDVMPR